MPRRAPFALALLAAAVVAVAWLPATPQVRDRAASWLVGVAADAGYRVAFDATAGNLWRGVVLHGAAVVGPGVELEVARLAVRWFTPALLVGELPLRVELLDVRGELRLGDLRPPSGAGAGAAPPVVRPRLDALRLEGGALRVAEAPYTLPDVTFDRVDATTLPDGRFRLDVTARTADGRLEGAVTAAWGSSDLEIDVAHADATVARAWWDGVEGGHVRGALRWGAMGADGRFEVTDGVVRAYGATATAVHGPVVWRGDRIEASLEGAALGGRLTARGVVDLAAARWEAVGEVDVDLAPASAALLAHLGAPALPPADAGRLTGTLRFAGWDAASVDGTLAADGAWLGSSLAAPAIDLAYAPDRGLDLRVDGRWGDGPLRLAAVPGAGGLEWRVDAGPVTVLGVPVASASGAFRTGGGPLVGTAAARAAGPGWSLAIEAAADAEGLRAFVDGTLLGTPFTGALAAPVLAADAALDGLVTWTPDPVTWTGAPTVALELGGRLGRPAGRATATAPTPVTLRAAEALLPSLDLRGALDLLLDERGLVVDGALGPVVVRGEVRALEATLQAPLPLGSALPLGGGLEGSVAAVRATWTPGRLEAEGEVTATVGAAWSAALGVPGDGVTTDGAVPWRASYAAGAWTLRADGDRWRAERSADGAWSGVAAGGALRVGAALATVDASGDAGGGTARVALGEALVAEGRWTGGEAVVELRSGGEVLRVALDPVAGASLDGALDLGVWSALGGPAPAGRLAIDAAWAPGARLPAGRADLALRAPLAAAVAVVADGRRAEARTRVAGVDLVADAVWPEAAPGPSGTLRVGALGPLAWDADGVRGAGRLPPWRWGAVAVPATEWSVAVDGAGARARVGGLDARWDPGERTLRATVDQPLGWGPSAAALQGRIDWTPERPAGRLDLALAIDGGVARATLGGDLDGLALAVDGPAAAFAAALDPRLAEGGAAALAGVVAGGARWRPGGDATAEARWLDTAGDPLAEVVATWGPTGPATTVAGRGWTLALDGGRVAWTGEDARLDTLLEAPPARLEASGALAWSATGWRGDAAGRVATDTLAARWRVVGDGALTLEGALEGAPLDAAVEGRLGVDGGVTGTWSLASAGAPALQGAGTWGRDAAGWFADGRADLEGGRAGTLRWPGFGATARWRPGAAPEVVGEGALQGDLADGWSLPIELAGEPATLRAAWADGARVALEHPLGTATLAGAWAAWSLEAAVRPADDRPVAVALRAAGAGTTASGRWWAGAEARPWATGTLALAGAEGTVEVPGATLDLGAVPGAPDGWRVDGDGALALRWSAAGWALDGTLDVQGEAGGVPVAGSVRGAGRSLEAAVATDELGGWSLVAAVADVGAVVADGAALTGLAGGAPWSGTARARDGLAGVVLAAADDAGGWRLAADVGGDGDARLDLTAVPGGSVVAGWSVGDRRGHLDADVAGVRVDAVLAPDEAGAPRLEVDAEADAVGATARLAGPLAPLVLDGRLSLAGGAPAPLRVALEPAPRLAWGGLALTWRDGALIMDGATAAGALPGIELEAASLTFRPGDGWSGGGRVAAAVGPVALDADLVADGALHADLEVRLAGRPVGGGRATPPRGPGEDWAGRLDLTLPLDALLGTAADDPVAGVLAATGTLGGRGASPAVDLALVLSGSAPAHGRARWDGRALEVDLVGRGLSATADWSAARGGVAVARVDDLDVASLLPFLEAPRLGLAADARWDAEGVSVRVDAAALRTAGGGVEGSGALAADGTLAASLRLDADLADVRVGTGLSGRVVGPLTYTGPSSDLAAGELTGRLQVLDAAVASVPATWRGEVVATGAAGDPMLRAAWRADGEDVALAGGATWRPRVAPLVEVQALGRAWGVDLDLDVGFAEGAFRGGGRVATDGGSADLRADGPWLRAAGVGGWSGWSGALDPRARRLALEGDLAALPVAASRGDAEVTIDWSDGLEVEARAVGVEVAGVAVGAIAVDGGPAAGWRVAGDRVAGEASGDARTWSVAVTDLQVPTAGGRAELRWVRSADGDVLEARWTAEDGEGLSARFEGALPGSLQGTVAGRAGGGTLTWPIARGPDGWRGDGVWRSTAADGPVADLRLSGQGALPEAEATVRGPGWAASAAWREGAALAALELAAPTGTLALRGRVWPDLDLVLDDALGGSARLRGGWSDGVLRIAGAARPRWGPVALEVAAPDRLRLAVDGVEGGWSTQLPPRAVLDAWAQVRSEGWRWSGEGAWGGSLVVGRGDGPLLALDGVTLALADATLALDGRASLDEAALDWRATGSAAGLALDGLGGALAWDGATARVGVDGLGTAALRLDRERARTTWSVDLASGVGGLAGELAWSARGWEGRVAADGVALARGALSLDVRGDGDALAFAAAWRDRRAVVALDGRWGAAPLAIGGWGSAPSAPPTADLRLAGLDLSDLAAARALEGVVAGSVAVRGDLVVGQFTTERLRVGGWAVPAALAVRGTLGTDPRGEARLDLGASSATLDVDGAGLAVFAQLERFPLHEAVAAALGPSDVLADVTGALRGAWRWGSARPVDLRLATEHVRLERAGVVTTGNLALAWDGAALRIGEARFDGRGTWRAAGSATAEGLDLELVADDADFSPLLGLVPAFARYAVTAAGDLRVRATGTLTAPSVTAEADALELGVAGTRYRLEGVRGDVTGSAWSARAAVAGVAPLGGRVDLVAGGRVGPFPERTFTLEARALGDLDVPLLGRVTELDADVRWDDDGVAAASATGRVGGPLEVVGTLAPLDLAVRGEALRLAVPFLFVADAVVDVDGRVFGTPDGVAATGRLDASEARIDLAARRRAAEAVPTPAPADGAANGLAATPDPEAAAAAARAALERVRFDGVRIVAPQRVTVAESFANAEAAVDLVLDGTAAAPRLAGTVVALRGTLRFAGRDLELREAVAAFDPARGVFPTLRVAGRTSFEKARVVPPGADVRFTAPSGPRFTVDVLLRGEATTEAGAFALDLEPEVSSDALVEGLGLGGARPLTELELLTLVALGRLEVTTGFAGAVAQNALDAAVDLLVTAEIQAALAETLGLDVVELRTTPVTSLFEGGDPFGVSLRLGGYLSDEVFASYRVSTLDGGAFGSFSNEVAFAYQLGPVAIDLTGRVDVAPGAATPSGPALGVAARYGFASGWSVELGLELSTERSLARLGVTWRW